MEYETFRKIVEEIAYGPERNWKTPEHGVDLDYNRGDDSDPHLQVRWRTAGAEGGSCWGDEARPIYPEEPVDITPVLAAILEAIAPVITFLQFMSLQRNLVESDTSSYSEYYGNWNEYAIRRIHIRKLYDQLKELGYLND